jgi:hypothetical protein
MLQNNQKIKAEEGDSNEFIEIVNKIVSITILQFRIEEICFVNLKNWFDHKWLNFSGKSVVHFDSSGMLKRDASLQEEWREKITVPPFNLNRVIWEKLIRKQKTGNKMFEKRLHVKKSSNDNIHNRIQNYTKNGLFVWLSSNSKMNKRGSLMVYQVQNEEIETWYANFEERDKWKVLQSKGIEMNELKGLIK